MNTENDRRVRSIRAAVAAVLGTTAFCLQTPVALSAQSDEEVLEEVQVTGSRIIRRDLDSTSPLITVGEESFNQTSNVAVEAALNRLPQFVPGLDQFDTADLQFNANSTVGATNVNLRGLGANRNLVLINGRRGVPVNASMVVDINSIPSAALQRVEIITGGASSVYGADAVAGVVNFILKDNYQGASMDVQYGITEEGDNQNLRVSGLIGGNFADNRGNAMLGIEYTNRGEALTFDRQIFVDQALNPYVGGTQFASLFTQFAANTQTGFGPNVPSQAVVNALFNQSAPGTVPNTSTFSLNPDGTVFVPTDPQGVYRYNGEFGLERKLTNTGTIAENSLVQRISSPLERYSLFGSSHFDVTDNVTLYSQVTFSQARAESIFDYVAAFGSWGALIPHGTGRSCVTVGVTTGGCQNTDPLPANLAAFGSWANVPTVAKYRTGGTVGLNCAATGGCTNTQAYPVPTELAQLLDSRPNPNAPFAINQNMRIFNDPRRTEQETTNYQLVAGVKGDLGVRDWTYDVGGTYGASRTIQNLFGVAALQRYRAVVGAPNYGRDGVFQGNSGPPGNGNNAPTATCTSGLPIFTSFEISPNCVDAVKITPSNTTKMDQWTAEAITQGGLFELPAGDLRFALGAGYRRNAFSYTPDNLLTQGAFTDSVIGLDPIAGNTNSDHVAEGFIELLVPVLADLPFATHLNLELGYRYSDYKYAGGVGTWKALADWAITPDLRLRGGMQRANRAPNLGEMFQKPSDTLGFSPGEPCGRGFTLAYGANPATNRDGATGAAAVEALCRTLMGSEGATTFYNNPNNQNPQGGFAFEFFKQAGNPDLESETANTYTIGAVWRSPFQHALSAFTMSLDYYSINIEDAITPVGLFTLYEQCYDSRNNVGLDPTNQFCLQLPRNQTSGGKERAIVSQNNVGVRETAGLDFTFNWGAELADMGVGFIPGRFSYSVNANYTLYNRFQDLPGANVRDNTGYATFDFRWQMFNNFGWSNGPMNANLRWRHYPSMENFARQSNPASLTQGTDAYDIVDLSGGYAFNQVLSLRFGIDNLLDKKPPINGYNPGANGGGPGDTGYAPGTIAQGAVFDVLGRAYYVGMSLNF